MNIILEIESVSHSRNGSPVLHDVNLKIVQGETVAIVGPSGSGKSTLLDLIMGVLTPESGSIYVDNSQVVQPSRDRGIVYQKYILRDFESVEMNVAIGPLLEETNIVMRFFRSFRDLPIKFMRNRFNLLNDWEVLEDRYIAEAHKWLKKVGLLHAAKRYPRQLSGGMQQRCAIAQALIMRPKVLLMDEPFGALDPQIRNECQRMMLDLQRENMELIAAGQEPKHTVIFVTHDRTEAIKIANRVIAISPYHPEGEKGATIVFDQATPCFDPVNPVAFDFPKAVIMEGEITIAAMDPNNRGDKTPFLTFWEDVRLGAVKGIFSTKVKV